MGLISNHFHELWWLCKCRNKVAIYMHKHFIKCSFWLHHVEELIKIHESSFGSPFGVRMTKLCLSEDCKTGHVEFGPRWTSGNTLRHPATWTCVQWPPNLVHSLYTQWRTLGMPWSCCWTKWRAGWSQPMMGNPKPRFLHATDPCHQLETHSGGILNVDSMTVQHQGWRWCPCGLSRGSMGPQTEEGNELQTWPNFVPKQMWTVEHKTDSRSMANVPGCRQATPSHVSQHVVPPNWLRSLPTDSRELPQP